MKNIIVATILFSLSTGLLHAMAPAGDDSVLGKRGPSDADWDNPAFLAAIDESVEDAFFDGPEVRAAVAKAEQEYASKRARPTVAAAAAARPPSIANIKVERLSGKEQHLRELISLIDGARQRVEIFSKTLEFLPKDLFQALKRAAFKGVQVTLTVQEVRNGRAADSLVEAGIQINDGRKTHTKFAVADEKIAIIGSFNFLSREDLDGAGGEESSFKITDNSRL